MNRKSCQDCGITWKTEYTIYDYFLEKEGCQDEAARIAKMYGASKEGQEKFGANMYIVEYNYPSPNGIDGWSETRCTGCEARRGRWTGNLLKAGQEEPPYGNLTR